MPNVQSQNESGKVLIIPSQISSDSKVDVKSQMKWCSFGIVEVHMVYTHQNKDVY